MAGLAWSGDRLARRPLAADALPEHGPQRRVRPRARPCAQLTALHLPPLRRRLRRAQALRADALPGRSRLYATNAALGAVAEIDLATRKVVRTARFAATRSRSGPGRSPGRSRGTAARSISARDGTCGRTTPPTESCAGPYRTGGAIAGFGFSSGDRRVHALRADGRLLTFDAATGEKVA